MECLAEGEQKPSHVMYQARLSYTQRKDYEARLVQEGSMTVAGAVWCITAHGRDVLKILREACA